MRPRRVSPGQARWGSRHESDLPLRTLDGVTRAAFSVRVFKYLCACGSRTMTEGWQLCALGLYRTCHFGPRGVQTPLCTSIMCFLHIARVLANYGQIVIAISRWYGPTKCAYVSMHAKSPSDTRQECDVSDFQPAPPIRFAFRVFHHDLCYSIYLSDCQGTWQYFRDIYL